MLDGEEGVLEDQAELAVPFRFRKLDDWTQVRSADDVDDPCKGSAEQAACFGENPRQIGFACHVRYRGASTRFPCRHLGQRRITINA